MALAAVLVISLLLPTNKIGSVIKSLLMYSYNFPSKMSGSEVSISLSLSSFFLPEDSSIFLQISI